MKVYDAAGNPIEVPDTEGQPIVQGGGEVAMVGPDGWSGTIPAENVSKALAAGYRLEAPEAHTERRLEQLYGDSELRAGLEGAARGLTFGISDVPLAAIDAEGVRERRERNPLAAGLGEVGGAVGGLALSGLGGLAERAGAAAFGGSGILARAGAAAVRGGVEGLGMGAGQAVSDLALSKDPLTAESVASSLGQHLVAGGGLGALGGGALSLAGSGLSAAVKGASKAVQKASGALAKELEAEGGAVVPGHEDVLRMTLPEARAAQKIEEEAWKAQQLEVGRAVADDLGAFREDLHTRMGALKAEAPKGMGIWKDAITAEKSLHKVISDPKTLAEAPARALEPLRRVQYQIDSLAKRLPQGALEGVEAGTPEALEAAARRAALGEKAASLSEQINGFEKRIQEIASAKSPRLDALESRIEALASPAKTPMLDALTKGPAAAIGGAIGHMTGIPSAGLVGGWIGRELGDTVLRPLAKKVLGNFVQHAGAIEDGAANLLSKMAPPKSAVDLLSDFANATAAKGGDAFERATNAVSQAATNPEGAREHYRQQLAGLGVGAPQTAELVADKLLARDQFLAAKMPPKVETGVAGQTVPPSDFDKAKFARYVAAAHDPLRILGEIRSGTLMPETVEAVRTLYPEIYARTQKAIAQKLADPGTQGKLDYPMRLQLGLFLGSAAEPTLAPKFVATLQAPYQTLPPKLPPPKLQMPDGQGAPQAAVAPTSAQRLTAK